MKNRKYLIVSPHSDDALLCCSHNLLYPEQYKVRVLTVENDEKRVKEDKALFDFLQIPYSHLEVDFRDESYYGYKGRYKDMTVESVYKFLREYFGAPKLNEIEEAIVSWVNDFLSHHDGYTVLAPWGVGHPFHLFVRETIQKTVSYAEYYRDFFHSFKKRAKPQVERQLEEYRLAKSFPVEEFKDVKWELAKKFYRSQSSFLFFEQGYIKKDLAEEVYLRKDDELPFVK